MNIAEAIEKVAQELEKSALHFGHGTDNPLDEAYALVIQSLKLSFDDETIANKTVTEQEWKEINELVKRRIEERKPLAYLTHEAYFFGMPFYVDERVIIPRSPIAELIEHQFSPWVDATQVKSVLDLCTGSGCIAIACAMMFEYARVDAVDLSPDALAVAKINVERHHLQKQVNLIHSDLFQQLPAHRYDIIVSNPPYVSAEEIAELPPEYGHEPNMALHAEDEGLALAIKILKEAPNYLSEHGILVIEVGNNADLLQERFPDVPFVWLEFEYGEDGVFLLTAEQLKKYQSFF